MKYRIFLFMVTVLTVEAQNWMDNHAFGAGGGSVEFKHKGTGAHVKAKKFGTHMSMGGTQMDNRPNPFMQNMQQQPNGGDDFFRNMPLPAGAPNIGPGGLSNFFQHLGGAGSTNMARGEGGGAASGEGIIFGEGAARSQGQAGAMGFGQGRGIVGSGDVIGHGQGFGMAFGQGGGQAYGRGPNMTKAMQEFQKWFGRK